VRDRKLATRYARALLSLLPEPRALEAADAFLDALRAAMDQSREVRDALLDPAVSRAQRKAMLGALATRAGMPPVVVNFLNTVVDHHRAAALPSIAVVFHEERERAMGIVPAELTTAVALADDQRDRARAALERATGSQVRLVCHVEPGLLGGAVTRIGSRIYDGSLRTQLAALGARMAQE